MMPSDILVPHLHRNSLPFLLVTGQNYEPRVRFSNLLVGGEREQKIVEGRSHVH